MSEINENIAPASEVGAGIGGSVPLGHKTADYYFDLPKELIAQDPNEQRDGCRMLCIDRNTGELEHKVFHDIIDYLEPGETLVLNNTRVIPARLLGTKEGTGANAEKRGRGGEQRVRLRKQRRPQE